MNMAEKMKRKTTLSFEVFPPKTEKGMEKLPVVLDELYQWSPDWISCTYGAGGSDKGYNLEICRAMAASGRTTTVSHYTCIHHTREDVERDIAEYLSHGVDLPVPVAVGVMPVLDRDKCIRHCVSMNGCAIPRSLARHISKYYDDPEGFREAGMDYTVRQMYEYLQLGVNDLHIYALNQSAAVDEILRRSGLFTKSE